MIKECTRDNLEALLGDVAYEIADGYVVSGLPKEVNGSMWIYSEEYWKTANAFIDYFQSKIDKRFGKIN